MNTNNIKEIKFQLYIVKGLINFESGDYVFRK